MKSALRVSLQTNAEQAARLRQLQRGFADVCNALAPVVRDNRCWNRVTLHHLTYHAMRQQFPEMGSQMICNAIYAVSLMARKLFQDPASPFHLTRLKDGRLPLLQFDASCPVYFDRHTLSLKEGLLSLYTLDGRMRFSLNLRREDSERFQTERVRQITLSAKADGEFELVFWFADAREEDEGDALPPGAAFQLPRHVTVGDRV